MFRQKQVSSYAWASADSLCVTITSDSGMNAEYQRPKAKASEVRQRIQAQRNSRIWNVRSDCDTERQLTTLGHNITAIEVNGTFDDCQALVKKAFLDKEATDKIRLSSANSINISRLIPQTFYYFDAYKQVAEDHDKIVFSIPSGNFGNLTAGILAKKMGLPVHHFIAATNANDVVPAYLEHGDYKPRPSVRTLSNAMDVGSPSNFARMLDLYGSTWNIMRNDISGYAFSDDLTRSAMQEIHQKYEDYIIDPHGAVGYLAYRKYQKNNPDTKGIILETAHSSKFLEDVESILGKEIPIPTRLAVMADKQKFAVQMSTEYEDFKTWLLQQYWSNVRFVCTMVFMIWGKWNLFRSKYHLCT